MLIAILLLTALALLLAYRFYGRFLERRLEVDDARPTPAVEVNDGVDYVPTSPFVLFGHHFSSIAGAGPIVGPIVAASAFGWGPAWLWVLLGAIFVGGVHDFGSTVVSLRHRGRSIIEAFRELVGARAGRVMFAFVFLAMIYVIVVFLDLTASGFVATPEVATASGWFVLVALAFGLAVRFLRWPSWALVTVFVALTYLGLALGYFFPAPALSKEFWIGVILVYCFVAAVVPVNVLLQPRDFLSATFLYAIMVLGLIGVLVRGGDFTMPVFKGFESESLGLLVPFLFITVACGACSGFHSMVCSGTTSKQLRRETDVRKVAYGGMLVEALLATFAIACVAVAGGMGDNAVTAFSRGAAVFFSALGIPSEVGVIFASLAVSTFLLTTLDTCTRLGRFLVEEFTGFSGPASRYGVTLAVVVVCGLLVVQKYTSMQGVVMPAWQALWPLFGATNQMLAALALVTLAVFLRSRRIPFLFAAVPAVIMVAMPMAALAIMAVDPKLDFLQRGASVLQLVLGTVIIGSAVRHLAATWSDQPSVIEPS
jgi:carbon starvation protein